MPIDYQKYQSDPTSMHSASLHLEPKMFSNIYFLPFSILKFLRPL